MSNAEVRNYFDRFLNFLVEKAIYLLDTDCTEVGMPAVSFLSDWLQCMNKFSEKSQNLID